MGAGDNEITTSAPVIGELDDVLTARAFTGLITNMLRSSIITAGRRRWTDIWSAGHTASGVRDIPDVAALVRRTRDEHEAARRARLDLA